MRPASPPSLALDRRELAAVFAGGFLGTLARAALAQSIAARPDQWPWATFTANMLGAALLGYVIARSRQRPVPSPYTRAFLASGICGALTTFSTLMLELARMIEASQPWLALGYAGASLAGGFAAVCLSTKLVRRAGAPR